MCWRLCKARRRGCSLLSSPSSSLPSSSSSSSAAAAAAAASPPPPPPARVTIKSFFQITLSCQLILQTMYTTELVYSITFDTVFQITLLRAICKKVDLFLLVVLKIGYDQIYYTLVKFKQTR